MDIEKNVMVWMILQAVHEGDQGLKGAALRLGMNLSFCSKLIQQLEDQLKTQLINRKTRPASLTDQALEILPFANSFIESYKRLSLCIENLNKLKKVVRLSVPTNTPREHFREVLAKYKSIDPSLEVRIFSDLDHLSVIADEADVAFLPYNPPKEKNEQLIRWRISNEVSYPMVSPQYIAKHGLPKHPKELKDHSVILREARCYPVTKYLQKGSDIYPLIPKKISFAGDTLSGKVALLNGDGISIDLYNGLFLEELKKGELVVALDGWRRPFFEITVVARKNSIGDIRLVNFIKWFCAQEEIYAKKRFRDLELFIENLDKTSFHHEA